MIRSIILTTREINHSYYQRNHQELLFINALILDMLLRLETSVFGLLQLRVNHPRVEGARPEVETSNADIHVGFASFNPSNNSIFPDGSA